MGLSVSVGYLDELLEYADEKIPFPWNLLDRWFGGGRGDVDSFRAELKRLNRVLRRAGLPEHVEPERVEEGVSLALAGYSGLHYLRRLAAFDALGMGLPPPGDEGVAHDPVFAAYEERIRVGQKLPYTHLMLHSDAEGFYVPLDFADVLISSNVAGGAVGSVQRLRIECFALARLIDLPAGVEPWSPAIEQAVQMQGEGDGWRCYGREAHTCASLLHACGVSLKTGAALVFI